MAVRRIWAALALALAASGAASADEGDAQGVRSAEELSDEDRAIVEDLDFWTEVDAAEAMEMMEILTLLERDERED